MRFLGTIGTYGSVMDKSTMFLLGLHLDGLALSCNRQDCSVLKRPVRQRQSSNSFMLIDSILCISNDRYYFSSLHNTGTLAQVIGLKADGCWYR